MASLKEVAEITSYQVDRNLTFMLKICTFAKLR